MESKAAQGCEVTGILAFPGGEGSSRGGRCQRAGAQPFLRQHSLCRWSLAAAVSPWSCSGSRWEPYGRAGGRRCRAVGHDPAPPPNCSVKEGANKEVLGILVSYRVKVKLVVARGG